MVILGAVIMSLALGGLIFYVTMRRDIFDARLAAAHSIGYVVSFLVLAVAYYFLAYFVSAQLHRIGLDAAGINLAYTMLALPLAFMFRPIRLLVDVCVEKVFLRNTYTTETFYRSVSDVLASTTDLRGLLRKVAVVVGGALGVSQVFFFVRHDGGLRYVSAGTPKHPLLSPANVEVFDTYSKERIDEVIIAKLLAHKHADLHQVLTQHHIAIALPLRRKNTIFGYLLLGERLSRGYSGRDVRLLKGLASELTIAIQYALAVQEVKDLNTHLQQRVAEATRELKVSNTRLRHLDTTKDEFLSMASHQLRTPLTSVKGYLSMVLEGDVGEITDAQRQLLSEAFVSSERMVHLIHDFLNVSRLQTGKFMLEKSPTDIAKLVRDEVDSLQHIASKRSMKLVLHVSGEFPLLMIDAGKLRQVVMNYIDNALFYSLDADTPITVMLARVDDTVELRVIDSGIGVPKAEQHQLFGRFFRAGNARKQRPDGTGVGLYLAKKVITEHGGEVIFLSEEGKGSTFGFRLPVSQLLAAKDEPQ